ELVGVPEEDEGRPCLIGFHRISRDLLVVAERRCIEVGALVMEPPVCPSRNGRAIRVENHNTSTRRASSRNAAGRGRSWKTSISTRFATDRGSYGRASASTTCSAHGVGSTSVVTTSGSSSF